MNFKIVGNKKDEIVIAVKNADTVQLNPGQPVVFLYNGTDDGLAVGLPSTAGSQKTIHCLAGVLLQPLAVGQVGYAMSYGATSGSIILQTRASTGTSWTAISSITAPVPLQVDPVNNGFTPQAAASASNVIPTLVLTANVTGFTPTNTTDPGLVVYRPFAILLRVS